MSLSIDPVTAQTALVAWLSVATVVGSAALAGLIKLWPQIQQLRALAAEHDTSIKQNAEAIVQLDHTAPELAQPVVDLPKDQQPGAVS